MVFRKTCFALWVGLVVAVLVNVSYGQESLPILEYLGQRAAQMAADLPPVPNNLDDWEKHRAELLKELAVVLSLPAREPMKAAVTDAPYGTVSPSGRATIACRSTSWRSNGSV